MRPWRAIAVAFVLATGACGSSGETSGAPSTARPDADPSAAVSVDQVGSSPRENVPSALDNPLDPSFPPPLIDPSEVRAGGPPPDGIPPIDAPTFLPVDDVDFLQDDEPVLSLELDGEARAYPIQVMTWHEIVNDTVAGAPVTVTYCPLCNSAIAFDRRVGERVLDFGTSGMLYNSSLIMYDRQTESLWAHFTGEAAIGFLTGERLETYPVSTVSWAEFRSAHPDGLVLSTDTGFSRDYGNNPYPGYDDVNTAPFLFDGEIDGRLAAKQRVIGIDIDGDSVAVRLDRLTDERVLDVEVAGQGLVVWVVPGTASALDGATISGSRDVGSTGVFVSEIDGQSLDFRPDADGFVDAQTGSRWNVFGQAVEGPLIGASLPPVAHVDTFWFAWGAFNPDSQIIG